MKKKHNWVIHPFMFGMFPILFLFAENAEEMWLQDITMPFLVIVVAVSVLFLLCAVVFLNLRKSGLVTSAAVTLFFSYGHATDLIPNFHFSIGGSVIDQNLIVLVTWTALLLSCVRAVIRTHKELLTLTKILNYISILLVAVQVIRAGSVLVLRDYVDSRSRISVDQASLPDNLPDIYYLVLDAYAREDVLRDIYGFDNSDFLTFLYDQGFHVASQSHCTYSSTLLSLASTLNVNLVPQLGDFDTTSSDRTPIAELLRNNTVFDYLTSIGYAIASFATGYRYTEFDHVDCYISDSRMAGEFVAMLLSTTPIPLFQSIDDSPYGQHRSRIIHCLKKLPNIYEINSPKFVFAHITCPHPPFVFDSAGNPVQPEWAYTLNDGGHIQRLGSTVEDYIKGYSDQLTYLNQCLRTMISELLATHGENPPIIILQSDHGPRSWFTRDGWSKSRLKEEFSTFSAFYLPGADTNPVHDRIANVNTFRIILNEYFNLTFELLPDRSLLNRWNTPYVYQEVTQQVLSYRPADYVTYKDIKVSYGKRKEKQIEYRSVPADGALQIYFDCPSHSDQLEICSGNDAGYTLYFCVGSTISSFSRAELRKPGEDNLIVDTIEVPNHVAIAGFNNILIVPQGDDGEYLFGFLRLL